MSPCHSSPWLLVASEEVLGLLPLPEQPDWTDRMGTAVGPGTAAAPLLDDLRACSIIYKCLGSP